MAHVLSSISWDDLETALTWHSDEGASFLDLSTGEVLPFTALEDELSEEEMDSRLQEGRLLRIEPLPSRVEYGWMSEFADSIEGQTLRRLLDVALSGSGAFRRFKDVISGYPAERQRWFAFRGERVRQAARDWLEDNEIAVP